MHSKMKLCIFAITSSLCICISGCGKKIADTNVAAGMELIEQYDFQGAIECFELARLNNEDLELTSRGEGLAYMGLGDYAKAESLFLEAIRNAGSKLTALEYDINYYLAAAYIKQGRYKEAQDIYSSIIALKKKEKDAYYLRACTLLKQNNYDEAVTDFEKAFSLDSDNLGLMTSAYVEMQAAGFGEEGKTYLNDYMEKKGKSLTNGEKGTIYYYLGDYENARTYLDGFVNGNDSEMTLMLGETYEKLGDINYATVVYQTYLNANTPDGAVYNGLGRCFVKQGKYEEAAEAFNAGIENCSSAGNSQYIQELKFNLIVVNEYLGNFSEAKKMMQEYLQAYPDDVKAKREYEFLQTR